MGRHRARRATNTGTTVASPGGESSRIGYGEEILARASVLAEQPPTRGGCLLCHRRPVQGGQRTRARRGLLHSATLPGRRRVGGRVREEVRTGFVRGGEGGETMLLTMFSSIRSSHRRMQGRVGIRVGRISTG